MITFPPEQLPAANLVVDAVYRGTRQKNAADDPLGPLLGVSNSGGFRFLGQLNALKLVVLTSSGNDPDWPDTIDVETGVLTYYGDNKRPGRELHDTPRWGNQLLRDVFADAQAGPETRVLVPPIFAFFSTGDYRDVRFGGLVVPGTDNLHSEEDLVAVWKSSAGRRFQNYRARFTVLNVESVSRAWIASLQAGTPDINLAPNAWQDWVALGTRRALRAARSIEHRKRGEQLPSSPQGKAMIQAIYEHFAPDPVRFEHFAASITRLILPDTASLDVTRPTRDGGRDGVGALRIGFGPGAILADFALEAKCYAMENSVGVREVSRLISRLRHRQFGVLVTTSYLHEQAYQEIKEDRHPIIVVAAADIVDILVQKGKADANAVRDWLLAEFPVR
ncbi:MAG: restriction endonuclease [Verrucomicrobiaceae bacterium]|nr:MAG: restriction endonuclease [Verrucomicrobiaceae bacterium]